MEYILNADLLQIERLLQRAGERHLEDQLDHIAGVELGVFRGIVRALKPDKLPPLPDREKLLREARTETSPASGKAGIEDTTDVQRAIIDRWTQANQR